MDLSSYPPTLQTYPRIGSFEVSYSLRDSNHWRAKAGQPPIQIGGDSYYSDPEVDEQEESVEVVASFFEDSERFEGELKELYAERRKNAAKGSAKDNNW